MPSGIPQPHHPEVRLQPLLAYGQGQRLKPLASRSVDGIAKQAAEKVANACATVEERRFSAA